MAKLTVVVGLPGSGKSHLIRQIPLPAGGVRAEDYHAEAHHDSPAVRHSRYYAELVSALRAGRDCAIDDIAYCDPGRRHELEREIRAVVPDVEFVWVYFANELARCLMNIIERNNAGWRQELAAAQQFSPRYTIPLEAQTRRVWRPDSVPASRITIAVQLLDGGKVPTKAHTTDAGWDCYAREEVVLRTGNHRRIPLGFKAAIPAGWYAQLRDKSGLAYRGLRISGGVIDAGYRGEWLAVATLFADGSEGMWRLRPGDPVCQFTLHQVPTVNLEAVEHLPPSERGEGGFGSTSQVATFPTISPSVDLEDHP